MDKADPRIRKLDLQPTVVCQREITLGEWLSEHEE